MKYSFVLDQPKEFDSYTALPLFGIKMDLFISTELLNNLSVVSLDDMHELLNKNNLLQCPLRDQTNIKD